MAQSFDNWLSSLGPLTRYALGTVVLLTAGASLGIIPIQYILLSPIALTELQLWRLLTAAFFFGGFSFPWLLSVAMFVSYVNYNETYDFKGKSGDLLWMGFFLILANAMGGLLLGMLITSFALLMSLCWVFCKRHPELRMTLYGFEFHANTFPWILLVFHLIIGQSILEDLLGIVVGHLFFFCRDVLPKTHGIDPLCTPAWFQRYVMPNVGPVGVATLYPAVHPQVGRFARQPPAANAGLRHRWGAGHVLGSE
ncbi:Derlin-2/3 [Trypanosoma rangeli]|uniref:Derlin n=1 Tax=Trypanosoma rangeli TaxID=5698 RepID=A0A422NV56_TRYRA|nr:Derlin-2/3 [Trypanosoma rangeli]RNF09351.1 Derlin-2/3 [Trypanosoma rangeli]|eukprot:RNF09351.1 Derlin-2/3 [Trypanosoma rangeli]